jgi:hypothetical protein
MLRRYTTSSFSGYSTCYRPRCYTSEGKAFALPGQKPIYPLHHHSRTQTRGRSNIASLAYILRFFSLQHLSSLFDKHTCRALFIWVYWPASGHGLHIIGRKQAGREAWYSQTNFTFACFKDEFVEEAHARGACQSFGGRISPANSRIMNFTFCQTTFHITSENVT